MDTSSVLPVVLPELGEGIFDAVIAEWFVSEGNHVEQDEDLVELVTDKAAFCVPAPGSGTVDKVFFAPGAKVKIGTVLAEIHVYPPPS